MQFNLQFQLLQKIFNQNSFFVQCEDNQIIFYYPFVEIFDLISGQRSEYFYQNIYILGMMQNVQQTIPLISKQDQLVVVFFSQNVNFFSKQDFQIQNYLFEYRYNNTSLFYDGNHKILIGLTGSLKQVNIINIPGNLQLFLYQCVAQFAENAVYYHQEQTSLIVVDSSPTIYLFNYLTLNVTSFRIDVNNIQGILMDKNKNIAFLYSNQFILTFQFPSMQFIETISLQNYNATSIVQVYLNTQNSLCQPYQIALILKSITFKYQE
ncbi:hypothetical protein TTHERM_000810507 (macronuclear) [Tetrahymena thermophila SB210]|uniref:Uncharacterized protein n=1 Tax=Tetrahymena thermophila (strain SB210) TaxID=312017 RepID=W7XA20_TETTS|nr:hypothetical protein TTHERM_000810507 [Tetrahymena thermophila SB210]EWS76245.1 hypothetical protein TTHERM_000810507 [Tetrahymena thermophila SB210]|eukprot:XP_012651204.1 hypothetical protein TTHERM_000810507 [Tetrahymena thermophila SB210]